MMLKASMGDSPAFVRDSHRQKLQEFDSLCAMLEALPHIHVAYYLFRCGGTVSKLQWWCRTTPRTHLSALLQDFHNRQERTLETFLGSPLINQQWAQAKLPTKLGGLGLVSTCAEIGLDVVSLAVGFLASHRRRMWPLECENRHLLTATPNSSTDSKTLVLQTSSITVRVCSLVKPCAVIAGTLATLAGGGCQWAVCPVDARFTREQEQDAAP